MPEDIVSGYWAIATQKHLKKFQNDSTNIDELDSLNVSGKAGRFIGMIRGNTEITNMRKLEKMAGTIGIGKTELYNAIIPYLERASDKKIEIKRDVLGEILGIEEYIFTKEEVLNITGNFFENLNPTNIERIAIETLGETKKIPLLENELMSKLDKIGFREEEIILSCAIQQQFKLLQKLSKGREPIYSNEYVWGPNHEKIAYGIRDLGFEDRESIARLIDLVQTNQGYPVESISHIKGDILLLARKTGIITPTRIVTNRDFSKEFVFSSNLIGEGLYNDDILDDVKILLAAIRFGENYTNHSKLNRSVDFLRALINRDKVGPHSANATDYIMLEKRGIVKTTPSHLNGRYYLTLLKKDVGEAALEVISGPNYDIQSEVQPVNFDQIMHQGDFLSAEEIRLNMVESPQHVREAEEHLLRSLRDENL